MTKIKRGVIFALIGITAFSTILMIGWFSYLLSTSPRIPIDDHVYSLSNHGDIFYITHAQHLIDDLLWVVDILAWASLIVLNCLWKVIPFTFFGRKIVDVDHQER